MSVNTMLLWLIVGLFTGEVTSSGILYPRESETRDVISLDGLWQFALSDAVQGYDEKWYSKQLSKLDNVTVELMPVPASYNDVPVSKTVRDHLGPVWYQKEFQVPKTWSDGLVWIRFGSVCYSAEVWINGESAVNHSIGHLPFQAEISKFLKFSGFNTITVMVDNTLTNVTIPQGGVRELESGRIKQTYTFDFFNYAGIDRSVFLYTTPSTYIDDITVKTSISGTNGIIDYQISIVGDEDNLPLVTLKDKNGKAISADISPNGTLIVESANFWWPYLMDPNPGYLYSMEVTLVDSSGDLLDSYTIPVGIRTVTWTNTSLLINDKPVYLRGFGRHEDSDITGKGFDASLSVRDYNLIRWIGANSYRTSHYPYAEEIMDLADRLGIMIIDECPAVNTENFSEGLLRNHKQSMTELIQRDKNRPGVIMWSAANEPRTQYPEAEDYYREVIGHIKALDRTRPVTVVNAQRADVDYSGQFVDIASFNLYRAWYENAGDLDLIVDDVVKESRKWYELHNIPVLVTEYGADTQEGYHTVPTYIWSEEYQTELMSRHFEAFDRLRAEGFFVGEMIWNFADFKTAQTISRVGGNKKGIFTRNRQPKASAHLMRKRYWTLSQELDEVEPPSDLYQYILRLVKDEL